MIVVHDETDGKEYIFPEDPSHYSQVIQLVVKLFLLEHKISGDNLNLVLNNFYSE